MYKLKKDQHVKGNEKEYTLICCIAVYLYIVTFFKTSNLDMGLGAIICLLAGTPFFRYGCTNKQKSYIGAGIAFFVLAIFFVLSLLL